MSYLDVYSSETVNLHKISAAKAVTLSSSRVAVINGLSQWNLWHIQRECGIQHVNFHENPSTASRDTGKVFWSSCKVPLSVIQSQGNITFVENVCYVPDVHLHKHPSTGSRDISKFILWSLGKLPLLLPYRKEPYHVCRQCVYDSRFEFLWKAEQCEPRCRQNAQHLWCTVHVISCLSQPIIQNMNVRCVGYHISFHEKPSTAMQDTSKNIHQLLCNVDVIVGPWQWIF